MRQLRTVAPHARFVSLYGATETVRALSYYEAADENGGPARGDVLPVGVGIGDVQLLVLNEALVACGVGELGQIAVRSRNMALGYHGDAALTAQKFIANPHTGDARDLLYLTGDLGRYRSDGVVECVGRRDRQVKVRGFRIELAEIEAGLASHGAVRQAAAVALAEPDGAVCIVAYVVRDGALTLEQLQAHSAARLPDYMLPSEIVFVEALALNENGKLDRSRLPQLRARAAPLRAPQTPLEHQLLPIWQALFKRSDIGVDDDFFRIGGHSLLATQVFVRIEREFGVELSYRDFFSASSIAAVAQRIGQAQLARGVQRSVKAKRQMTL